MLSGGQRFEPQRQTLDVMRVFVALRGGPIEMLGITTTEVAEVSSAVVHCSQYVSYHGTRHHVNRST
jgi:hypothetical protein